MLPLTLEVLFVSGLDAVEIEPRSGRKYRIGTDVPRLVAGVSRVGANRR